jgi:hypothetical protein
LVSSEAIVDVSAGIGGMSDAMAGTSVAIAGGALLSAGCDSVEDALGQ